MLLRDHPSRTAVDVAAILDEASRNRQRRRKMVATLVLTAAAVLVG